MRYNLGLLIGRFQTIHLGHEKMIRTALELCDRVVVFVGSSQESGTEKNPFDFNYRTHLLKQIFGYGLIILPLEDAGIGNNSQFGQYVIDKIPKNLGMPDLIISGKEARRADWFADYNIDELFLAKYGDISATRVRELMLQNNFDGWCKLVPKDIHKEFDKMRELLLLSRDNLNTKSI